MNQEYRPTETEAVSNLQRYLRQLSYFDDAIPAPPIDGIFGALTRQSLIAFQEQNGLPATGTANETTWNLLYEKYVLSILLAADIPSDDYESSTKFALVYKKLDVIEAQGESLFECKITLREPAELAEIIDAASYFGAEVCKVHSLPLSSGGRENSFDIIFGIDKADIAGLFAYLMLKYPHLSPIGIYTLMEDW